MEREKTGEKGKTLPTIEEAEKVVREMTEKIAERIKILEKKIPATDKDFGRTVIN